MEVIIVLRAASNVSQKKKFLEYDINYAYNNTDGISEAKDTTGKAGFDNDGFKQQAIQAVLGFNITDNFKLSPITGLPNSKEIMTQTHLLTDPIIIQLHW